MNFEMNGGMNREINLEMNVGLPSMQL